MLYNPTIPLYWDEDMAYIFGLLLGDGSLPRTKSVRPNGKYQKRYLIYFFSNSKDFLDKVYIPLFTKLFSLSPHTTLVKNKKNPLYNCKIESKLLYNFLKNSGYTVGRKAKIATIPKIPKKYRPYLLAGLLDTDGGKKGNGFGLSTASKHFASFCINVFKDLNIPYTSCPWYYKGHVYHQIYVKGSKIHSLNKIPLRNHEKIDFIKSKSAFVAQPGQSTTLVS